MSAIDSLLRNNASYAEGFEQGGLGATPTLELAIVTCMDSRLAVFPQLGLQLGNAHVIRNAGGIVTADVLRSLTISQRLLGTREVMLIQHTGCGMLSIRDEELKQQIRDETGHDLPFEVGSFTKLEENVRESLARIRESTYLPHTDAVRGFVYEVETGRLREIA